MRQKSTKRWPILREKIKTRKILPHIQYQNKATKEMYIWVQNVLLLLLNIYKWLKHTMLEAQGKHRV